MRLAFKFLILVFAMAPSGGLATASPDRLAAIAWLVGDWGGVGEGQPGTSGSTRHAQRIQNGRFISVESRSVYPKQERNGSGDIHTSLDVWSFDRRRNLLIMRQFDSLGFASTYVQDRAASADGRLVLVSEHMENVPPGWRARYTYQHAAPDEYTELFELDSGSGYQRYVFNRLLRLDRRPAH